MIEIKLEEAILAVQGLKLELRKTDLEIDNIISEPESSQRVRPPQRRSWNRKVLAGARIWSRYPCRHDRAQSPQGQIPILNKNSQFNCPRNGKSTIFMSFY